MFVRPLSYEMRLSFYRHTKQAEVEATENELDQMGIPKRALSLMWNQRSVDTFLGLPFNIASYGLLLSIICYEVKMLPDLLIGNFGDTHLYLNHFEQAKEQIFRDPYDLPKLKFSEEFLEIMQQDITFAEKINKMTPNMFMLDGYQSHPAIKAPLSN
jgi:thymidylate synthase